MDCPLTVRLSEGRCCWPAGGVAAAAGGARLKQVEAPPVHAAAAGWNAGSRTLLVRWQGLL